MPRGFFASLLWAFVVWRGCSCIPGAGGGFQSRVVIVFVVAFLVIGRFTERGDLGRCLGLRKSSCLWCVLGRPNYYLVLAPDRLYRSTRSG